MEPMDFMKGVGLFLSFFLSLSFFFFFSLSLRYGFTLFKVYQM